MADDAEVVVSSCRGSVSQCWHRAWERWYRLQVSRQGKYSIERLQALDEYCRTTPLCRVLSVCFLTPLPPLLATLLIECMPLRDPYSEWRHDWALWTRIWFTMFFVSFGIVTVVMKTIVRLPLTRLKCVIIAIGTATGYTGMLCIIAIKVVYPVPFVLVLGGPPSCVICSVMLVLVTGIEPFRVKSRLGSQLKWFFRFSAAQAALVIIYPGYNAIFVSVETKTQNALVLALPLIKLVVKNGVSRSAVHLEDYLPETVVFLVEVFNTLYLTVCMQNTRSILTALLIMFMDFIQVVWALRGVHRRTNIVQEMITGYTKRHASSSNEQVDFLKIVIGICEHPMKLEVPELARIRLRACLKHSLSQHSNAMLTLLEKLNVYGDSSSAKYGNFRRMDVPKSSRRSSLQSRRLSNNGGAIVPMTQPPLQGPSRLSLERHSVSGLYDSTSSMGRTDSNKTRLGNAAAAHKTRLLFQTLQMLFHCEYLVLVQYVKCFVPLMYVVYFLVRSQLPNAQYYPSTSRSLNDTVTNVLIYASVELLSFTVLHTMFKRKFRFSPLYQLAFVLENQFELVQSKLLIWTIILLQFQLRHFGTRMPECKHGDLNFAPDAYTAVTKKTPGREQISWSFVDCPDTFVAGNLDAASGKWRSTWFPTDKASKLVGFFFLYQDVVHGSFQLQTTSTDGNQAIVSPVFESIDDPMTYEEQFTSNTTTIGTDASEVQPSGEILAVSGDTNNTTSGAASTEEVPTPAYVLATNTPTSAEATPSPYDQVAFTAGSSSSEDANQTTTEEAKSTLPMETSVELSPGHTDNDTADTPAANFAVTNREPRSRPDRARRNSGCAIFGASDVS